MLDFNFWRQPIIRHEKKRRPVISGMDSMADDELQVKTKKGFVRRIVDFFSGFRKRKKELDFSRFSYLIADLDKKHMEYDYALAAVKLCDEAVSIIGRRISLLERHKAMSADLLKYECYDRIDENGTKEFKEFLERLRALATDRDSLRTLVTSFDPALARISELEEEAASAVPEIQDAEEKQRAFKHDMNYLKGEKSELEYERESLMRGASLVRKFLVGVACAFVLCTVIMGLAYVVNGAQIAVPMFIMIMLAIILAAMLYGFDRRIKNELTLNHKKQQKAVGILNTKSAVFAHYTNFLNHTYKKYKVRNAEMLKNNLREYEHYKHLTKRYDAIRKMADETEKSIVKFVSEHGLPKISGPIDEFARSFNLDEKLDVYKTLDKNRKGAGRDLLLLDEIQERLWDELIALNRIKGGVVDGIIKCYVQEANKIMLNPEYLKRTEEFKGLMSVREIEERKAASTPED